ncbi:hypothetical protein K438DRAFT_2023245 [Mycena galopus ATCC 62051]|nr:hypothetical protein K438DRAFT_2023245 [Mycena galopus ATCC 62051]
MEETIDHMITLLTAAAVQSEGIPTRAVILVTYQEPTGQCGHPRIEINPSFLAYGLDLHGPKGLAPVAGVSMDLADEEDDNNMDWDVTVTAAATILHHCESALVGWILAITHQSSRS